MLEIIAYMIGFMMLITGCILVALQRSFIQGFGIMMGILLIVAAMLLMGMAYVHARNIESIAEGMTTEQIENLKCIAPDGSNVDC